MQCRKLGKSDIEASVIAMGTWAIGGWMWGGSDDSAAVRAIRTALDSGITLIDTAPIYGFGHSEEVVGQALRGVRRDSYVLATKCGIVWDDKIWESGRGKFHVYVNEKGVTPTFEKMAMYIYADPDSIRREVDNSLCRLGLDYIDLMQVHHCGDYTTPIAETMGALDELKKDGKIRAIGISNATVDQIREYADSGPLDVDQEKFSLIDRTAEKNGVLEECKNQNLSFFAYSPMENGLLTGKLDPNRIYNSGDMRKNNPAFAPDRVRRVNFLLNEFRDLAEKYGLSIGQLIIAWTFAKYEKTHILCGARTVQQVIENANAGNVSLTPDEVHEIDERVLEMNL